MIPKFERSRSQIEAWSQNLRACQIDPDSQAHFIRALDRLLSAAGPERQTFVFSLQKTETRSRTNFKMVFWKPDGTLWGGPGTLPYRAYSFYRDALQIGSDVLKHMIIPMA